MKRLLTILFLSFIVNYSFAQVKVNSEGDIIPTGIYPAVKSSNIKGTVHFFQTLTQRDALPNNFRDTGMIAYVQQSSKFYYLDNGIQNSNWKELILTGYDDKVISGGFVSWISGLTFNVSASIFRKFGVIYYTSDTTITLDPADVNYNRIDLFAVDTTNGGEVVKITGTPSPTSIAPQTQDFQIALTTGITLNVGDTVPSNVSIQKIYDENIEWATSTDRATVDFNNTTFPYTGSKDAFVSSYANIGRLVFTRSGTGVIDGSEVLKFRISLNSALRTKKLSVGFFHGTGTTLSSNIIGISSNNGLDPNKINQYQTITIPVSYFQWSDYSYNRIILYISDYDTSFVVPFYLDDIELQRGINNIPNPTDYSNKVDSVVTRNDSSFYVTKGIYHYFKYGADSSKLYIQQAGAGETHIIRAANDTTLSVATLKNTDDITPSKNSDSSVSFNFTNPHYTKDQVDSIKATITADGITRAELIDTADNKVNKTDVSGGTINQVLKKNSSTDYDWSWQDESGIDTTSLSNRINTKIDSVRLSTDSLFAKVNGVWLFQFKSSAFNQWRTNGTKIYYNTGNVGIGVDTPYARLQIATDNLGTSVNNNSGLLISNSTPATNSTALQYSPPIILKAGGWNSTTNTAKTQMFRMSLKSSSSVSGADESGSLLFESSTDNGLTWNPVYSFTRTYGATVFSLNGSVSSAFGNAMNDLALTSVAVGPSLQLSATNGGVSRTVVSRAGSFALTYVNNPIVRDFAVTTSINTTAGTTDYTGYLFAPTTTGTTGLDLKAFANTIGNNTFNTTSGGTAIGASSIPSNTIFKVQSTTQTSHPFPNMTESQKNAITSPNVGDHVYQTDGTEGVYVYKSTGWTFAY